MQKKAAWIAVTILILMMTVMGFFFLINRREYTLELPKAEDLKSIAIAADAMNADVTNVEEIKDIIYVIGDGGRTTKRESLNDSPANAEIPIKIEFCFAKGGSSLLYIYTQDNRYYIEQPYNGIYQISGDEYNSIAKYVL